MEKKGEKYENTKDLLPGNSSLFHDLGHFRAGKKHAGNKTRCVNESWIQGKSKRLYPDYSTDYTLPVMCGYVTKSFLHNTVPFVP